MAATTTPEFRRAPCSGCGKPIVWAVTEDGKRIPLDPRPPTYFAFVEDGRTIARRAATTFVSHFATCPSANDFSRGRRP